MADQALADAITALTAALANLQHPQPPAPPNAPQQNVAALLDPFDSDQPFDLTSRSGSQAFTTASAPLDETWDGTIQTFPSFLISLRVRASEVKWDAPPPCGILTYTIHGIACNLFTKHHSISEAELEQARTLRINDRARQNAKALYKCLKASITGDIKATLFDQDGNIPLYEDGPLLFKKLTSFTIAASLQLSMLSFKQILEFSPAEHKFNIPMINTRLNHLFVLATTRDRRLTDAERIQHTLTAYARIKQPEAWAQWVRNQIDAFDSGLLQNCQSFMNSASLKFTKISSSDTGFEGSLTTVQEDIVAMVANPKRKRVIANVSTDGDDSITPHKNKLPPFVKHYKSSNAADAQPYKVGDSKTWNNLTWYFCDCPNHRDRIKWHTHTADSCHSRQRWLANPGSRAPPPTANVVAADAPTALTTPTGLLSDSISSPDNSDVTALLAAALSHSSDNSTARDLIADALNALHHA